MKRLTFLILAVGLFCAKANCFIADDDYEFSRIVSPGTITRVQSAQNFANGLSNVKAFTSANTAGNMIVIGVIAGFHTTPTITSIVDTKLNNYTVAISSMFLGQNSGDANMGAIYYAKDIAGGANTVTVTLGVGTDASTIFIVEYAGLNASSPLVAISSGTGRSSSPTTATSIATNGEGNLVVGVMSAANSGTPTLGAGTGFTIVQQDNSGATDPVGFLIDQGIGPKLASGSYTPNGTRSNENPDWGMTGAVFKP